MSLPGSHTSLPRWLLAVDMDGTLLRDDKTIAPEDVAAIQRAAENGIVVTLATGRLTTGALPTARRLGLVTPLICADGAVLVDPETGVSIEQRVMREAHARGALEAIVAHGLMPYVFLADSIHCELEGEQHRSIVGTWTRELVVHASLAAAEAWQATDCVAMTLGLGGGAHVELASEHLRERHGSALDTVHFAMAGTPLSAVRSLPRGCDKAEMLAQLAGRMQLPAARVAAVGDWLNDLGMLRYAGRSFAMGHAPSLVRQAATDVLVSTSRAGGGVAEAIGRLLAGSERESP